MIRSPAYNCQFDHCSPTTDQVELERVKRVETELSEEQVADNVSADLILIIVTLLHYYNHTIMLLHRYIVAL